MHARALTQKEDRDWEREVERSWCHCNRCQNNWIIKVDGRAGASMHDLTSRTRRKHEAWVVQWHCHYATVLVANATQLFENSLHTAINIFKAAASSTVTFTISL